MSKILKIKTLLQQIKRRLISKYFIISVLSYVYIFLGLYLLIDVLNFNKKLSFIIVYGIAYVLLYVIQLKFLFSKKHDKKKLIKYCFAIVVFYLLANALFNVCLFFNINYMFSTAITIIVLLPIRFLTYMFVVYKDDD